MPNKTRDCGKSLSFYDFSIINCFNQTAFGGLISRDNSFMTFLETWLPELIFKLIVKLTLTVQKKGKTE